MRDFVINPNIRAFFQCTVQGCVLRACGAQVSLTQLSNHEFRDTHTHTHTFSNLHMYIHAWADLPILCLFSAHADHHQTAFIITQQDLTGEVK